MNQVRQQQHEIEARRVLVVVVLLWRDGGVVVCYR